MARKEAMAFLDLKRSDVDLGKISIIFVYGVLLRKLREQISLIHLRWILILIELN